MNYIATLTFISMIFSGSFAVVKPITETTLSNNALKISNNLGRMHASNTKRIDNPPSPFVGEWNWEKNSATKDFSLTIKQSGGKLIGTYCYTLNSGDKVDCAGDATISFSVPLPSGNSFVAAFASTHSQTKGLVQITFDGTYLIWTITKEPTGEYYSPMSAKLIRQP